MRGADPTHVAGNLRLHISSRDWASRAAIHPQAASRFLVAMDKCGIVRYATITPDETGTSDKSEVLIIPAAFFDCELMADFVSALDDEIETRKLYTRNKGGKRLNNNADFATNIHQNLFCGTGRAAGGTGRAAISPGHAASSTGRAAISTGRAASGTPSKFLLFVDSNLRGP